MSETAKKPGILKKTFMVAAVGLPAIAASGIGYAWYSATDSYAVRHVNNATVYSHARERYKDRFMLESDAGYSIKEITVPDDGSHITISDSTEHVHYFLGISTSRGRFTKSVATVDPLHISQLKDLTGDLFDDADDLLKQIERARNREMRISTEKMLRTLLKDTPVYMDKFTSRYGSYEQAGARRLELERKSEAGVEELLGMNPATIQMDYVKVQDSPERVYAGQDCQTRLMPMGKMMMSMLDCHSKYRDVERHHMEPRLPKDIQDRLDAARRPYAEQAAVIRQAQRDYDFIKSVPSLLAHIEALKSEEKSFLQKYGDTDKAYDAAQAMLDADAKGLAKKYEQKSKEIPLVAPLISTLKQSRPGL
jgi:hypothetical protein